MTQILEAIMLLCFGLSWPINLIKNIKAGSANAMSLKFILLIITGYVAGIAAKIVTHQFNYVLLIYLFNMAVTLLNLVVYFINSHKDTLALQTAGEAPEVAPVEKVVITSDNVTKAPSSLINSAHRVDFYAAMGNQFNTCKQEEGTNLTSSTGRVDFYSAMNR